MSEYKKIIIFIFIHGVLLKSFSGYTQSHLKADINIGTGAVIYNPKTGPELAPLNGVFNISWLPFGTDYVSLGVTAGFKFRIPNTWDSVDTFKFQSSVETGIEIYYRRSIDWAAGISLRGCVIYKPYTAAGAGIRSFGVYYITGGLGILIELNGYWYYGVESVLTLGYGLGLLIDYEYWRN